MHSSPNLDFIDGKSSLKCCNFCSGFVLTAVVKVISIPWHKIKSMSVQPLILDEGLNVTTARVSSLVLFRIWTSYISNCVKMIADSVEFHAVLLIRVRVLALLWLPATFKNFQQHPSMLFLWVISSDEIWTKMTFLMDVTSSAGFFFWKMLGDYVCFKRHSSSSKKTRVSAFSP